MEMPAADWNAPRPNHVSRIRHQARTPDGLLRPAFTSAVRPVPWRSACTLWPSVFGTCVIARVIHRPLRPATMPWNGLARLGIPCGHAGLSASCKPRLRFAVSSTEMSVRRPPRTWPGEREGEHTGNHASVEASGLPITPLRIRRTHLTATMHGSSSESPLSSVVQR